MLVEELVLSNQAQLERNETLTVQNEDLRGESNEVVSVHTSLRSEFNRIHGIVPSVLFSRKFLNTLPCGSKRGIQGESNQAAIVARFSEAGLQTDNGCMMY